MNKVTRYVLVFLGLALLAGCGGKFNMYATMATEKMCTLEGQSVRLTFRTLQDGNFRANDQAICVRCPGEEVVSCTGDPKGLPVN